MPFTPFHFGTGAALHATASRRGGLNVCARRITHDSLAEDLGYPVLAAERHWRRYKPFFIQVNIG